MSRKVLTKVIAILLMIAFLLPYASPVMAVAKLTQQATSAKLYASPIHAGGVESTGEAPEGYDSSSYQYRVGGTTVFKIGQAVDDSSLDDVYPDSLYCLDGNKSFPDVNGITYYNRGQLTDKTNSYVRNLALSDDNYSAVLWLLGNIYLSKSDPSSNPNYKREYLSRAFNIAPESTQMDVLIANLTDDDIDVVQQWALWYFTNYNNDKTNPLNDKYKSFNTVTLQKFNGTEQSYADIGNADRQELCQTLYDYLVSTAAIKTDYAELSRPTIEKTQLTVEKSDANYVVGPFKVNSGDIVPNYIKLVDEKGKDITNYSIRINGEATTKKIDEIYDTEFYVYVPISSEVSKVRLVMDTTVTVTSIWTSDDNDNQPVVLITRENIGDEHGVEIVVKADLALKKYVVGVDGKKITRSTDTENNAPVVSTVPLLNGKSDAKYMGAKDPVSVEAGSVIKYEFRVYNEGQVDAAADAIVDYLPAGLSLKEDSDVNTANGWKVDTAWNAANHSGITKIYTTNTKDHVIPKFNMTTGEIESYAIQAEIVVDDLSKNATEAGLVLTNIGEVIPNPADGSIGYEDGDSTPGSINPDQIDDINDYTGNPNNPEDLSKKDEEYRGLEDDDDFEKVVFIRKKVDLALKKYIVKHNDEVIRRSAETSVNEPKVNAKPLIEGQKNAEYYAAKEGIEVKKGDKVVFEISVYNEGQADAAATMIVDYLPEGLTVVDKAKSTINNKYGWAVSDNGRVAVTDYTKSIVLKAFDPAGTVVDGQRVVTVNKTHIQIECEITGDLSSGKVLTNVAEIYDQSDKFGEDSNPKSIDPKTIDPENYTGNVNNKSDLSDKNYDYKGLEDDDDFEKVIIAGGTHDLALKKFISKIQTNGNKEGYAYTEPTYDVSPLKQGKTDAIYTISKTPKQVATGDIVTYKIRVYNEGTADGYAEEVADYLPKGLGFLVGFKGNVDNYWAIPEGSKTVKLSTIKNATKNLSVDQFVDITKLEDVEVVTGDYIKLTSTFLSSAKASNLLKGFDPETGKTLDYKDITITCIVMDDKLEVKDYKNIAEVSKQSDENKVVVPEDLDSTPDTVDPKNYPDGEKRPDGTSQDDHDYENLTPYVPQKFDLSLQKFATSANEEEIKGKEPIVTYDKNSKKLLFTRNRTATAVANNDIIVYTIRVYNEGEVAGYAEEIADDIPTGLIYLPEHDINKEYGWELYDKSGKKTTDINQAAIVKTQYLSKAVSSARNDDALLKAFNPDAQITTEGKVLNPDYRDVQIAFMISEEAINSDPSLKQTRAVRNTAEITEDADENGDPIDDDDSTPNNWNTSEDDLDQEEIHIKYFDLALTKKLEKIIVTVDGKTTEINAGDKDALMKVEINKKKLASTKVKFVYKIEVENQGEISGYATEITDYIPDGLKFVQEDNKQWTPSNVANVVTTNALAKTLLKPGAKASVNITLEWINGENNLGQKVNVAEISEDYNFNDSHDIDSTPNNKVVGEDDLDTAPVLLSISTGAENIVYLIPVFIVSVAGIGFFVSKKFILK